MSLLVIDTAVWCYTNLSRQVMPPKINYL